MAKRRMSEAATIDFLSLPPAFRLAIVADGRDALTAAREMAEAGAEPGTLVWAPRDDVADAAVVLAPSEPLAPSLLVAYAVMVAVGEALGALIPPVIPVAFGWPDRIVVNGARAGGIRLLAAPAKDADAIPDWMVAGVTLAFRLPSGMEEPGRRLHSTALEAEGCDELTVREFLESFARHFLYWMNRWQEDGFAPLRHAWLERAVGYGEQNQGMETTGPWAARRLLAVGDDGAVRFADGDRETVRPLADILGGPTWTE